MFFFFPTSLQKHFAISFSTKLWELACTRFKAFKPKSGTRAFSADAGNHGTFLQTHLTLTRCIGLLVTISYSYFREGHPSFFFPQIRTARHYISHPEAKDVYLPNRRGEGRGGVLLNPNPLSLPLTLFFIFTSAMSRGLRSTWLGLS